MEAVNSGQNEPDQICYWSMEAVNSGQNCDELFCIVAAKNTGDIKQLGCQHRSQVQLAQNRHCEELSIIQGEPSKYW